MALIKALLKPVKAAAADSDGVVIFQPWCLHLWWLLRVKWLRHHMTKAEMKKYVTFFKSRKNAENCGSNISSFAGYRIKGDTFQPAWYLCRNMCEYDEHTDNHCLEGDQCRRRSFEYDSTKKYLSMMTIDHICSDDCSGRLLQHRWKAKALQVVGQAEGESSSSSGELRLLASGQ